MSLALPHPATHGAPAVAPAGAARGRDTSLDVLTPPPTGARRFTWETLRRDAVAGSVTGLMAVPLTVGICLMSEYPIPLGLATVICACVVSFLAYLVRPGNHVGVPGVAAGLAPVLALGTHKFGMDNMPFLIALSAFLQFLVWRFRWEGHVLRAVPAFLVEGLLAGVGLKIALKFLPAAWDLHAASVVPAGATTAGLVAASAAAMALFLYLYRRFHLTSPGLPYIGVIAGGAWLATAVPVPMLHVEPMALALRLPTPHVATWTPTLVVEMGLFAMMLAVVDVIEQVMSNAAIEKIDPLGRKSDSNNSLLVMWLANALATTFGGMTNLDGLAKSSTNRMAGAMTKASVLFVAAILAAALAFPHVLGLMPEFALAVLMIFTGGKMMAGLYHVAAHGKYGLVLALFCGLLVFRLGIFEGLLLAMAVHAFVTFLVYRHGHVPALEILKKVVAMFSDRQHAHASATLAVEADHDSGGLRYRSVTKAATSHKTLDDFIADWADGVNRHNLLSTVGCYDAAGLLWGTFAKDLRSGHFHIKRYFEHLFELDDVHVTFESGETRQYRDIYIRSGAYAFNYLRKGERVRVPARYSFVCKREPSGWYILEHHSSEFPA